MDRRSGTLGVVIAFALVATVGIGVVGCGPAPKSRAAELVGKWVRADGASDEVILDLRSDALGTTTLIWPPHGASIRWVVAGDDLVLTTMDGTQKVRHPFRIEGPGLLALGEGERPLRLKRLDAEGEGEAAPEAKEGG